MLETNSYRMICLAALFQRLHRLAISTGVSDTRTQFPYSVFNFQNMAWAFGDVRNMAEKSHLSRFPANLCFQPYNWAASLRQPYSRLAWTIHSFNYIISCYSLSSSVLSCWFLFSSVVFFFSALSSRVLICLVLRLPLYFSKSRQWQNVEDTGK